MFEFGKRVKLPTRSQNNPSYSPSDIAFAKMVPVYSWRKQFSHEVKRISRRLRVINYLNNDA